MPDGRRADLLHDPNELRPQQLQYALYAWLAESPESPDVWSADPNCGRAHAQRLADVGATAEAGVNEDWDAAVDGLNNLGERIDGGAAGILAAGSVVGHDDGIIPIVCCKLGIFPGKQALNHDLHFGDVAQPLEIVPGHCRRLDVAQPREIDALIHRLVALIGLDARTIMAVAALARVGPCQPEQGLLVAAAGAVDRDGNG